MTVWEWFCFAAVVLFRFSSLRLGSLAIAFGRIRGSRALVLIIEIIPWGLAHGHSHMLRAFGAFPSIFSVLYNPIGLIVYPQSMDMAQIL